MKIVIESGTKDSPPMGLNTFITVDGKKIHNHINTFSFHVEADGLAYWNMGMADKSYRTHKDSSEYVQTTLERWVQ